MDTGEAQNRKARRAAAKATGKPIAEPTTAPRIKLAHPDYSQPQGKTLLDIYNEKSDLLSKGQPFDKKYEDGFARDEDGNILTPLKDEEVIGPVADAFFWAVSLTMLHFTLDVLAQNQYKQSIDWKELSKRSGTMMPVLWIALFLLRSKLARRWHYARQGLFLMLAVIIGNYTIEVANKKSYYAVMKQVPPLGTVWIYSVIEMDALWALVGVSINFAYLYVKGYTVF